MSAQSDPSFAKKMDAAASENSDLLSRDRNILVLAEQIARLNYNLEVLLRRWDRMTYDGSALRVGVGPDHDGIPA